MVPVFYSLSPTEARSITDIAREIGHTHPLRQQIVREWRKGYITEKKGESDGRKNFISSHPPVSKPAKKCRPSFDDVTTAIEKAMKKLTHDLWKAIAEMGVPPWGKKASCAGYWKKKDRESSEVQIVDYTPADQSAFRRLNEEWITKYFRMEEAIIRRLDHPGEYIPDKGGLSIWRFYKERPSAPGPHQWRMAVLNSQRWPSLPAPRVSASASSSAGPV